MGSIIANPLGSANPRAGAHPLSHEEITLLEVVNGMLPIFASDEDDRIAARWLPVNP
jgi:hypothetical protein